MFKTMILNFLDHVPRGLKNRINSFGFKKYLKNMGWLFVGRMITLLISFFVGIVVARYLGPVNYGLLNYVISFVGLFGFASSLGLDGIAVREIVNQPNNRDKILGTVFSLKIFGGIISILLIVLAIFLTNNNLITKILVAIVSLTLIFQTSNVVDLFFQANVLSKKTALVQVVSYIISSLLKILFIILKQEVYFFVLLSVFDSVVLAFGFFSAYKKNGFSPLKWSFDWSLAKFFLNCSWPLIFTEAAMLVYFKIDQVLIKNMMGNESLGIYSAALKIAEMWYFIPMIITGSLFPAILNSRKVSVQLFENRLSKLYTLMFWLAIIISLPISVFSTSIIKFLFGVDYLGAASVLVIYVWGGVGVFLTLAVSKYLLTENYTKIYFCITLVGALSNVLINLLVIPHYGLRGSAFATVFSYCVVPLSLVFFKKTRHQLKILLKSFIFLK